MGAMRLSTGVLITLAVCLVGCGDDGGTASADANVSPSVDAQIIADAPVPDATSDASVPVPSPRFVYKLGDPMANTERLYIGGILNGVRVAPQQLHDPLGTNQWVNFFRVSNDGKWVAYEVRTHDGTLPNFWASGGGGGTTLDYTLYVVDISGAVPGPPTQVLGPLTTSIGYVFTGDSNHLVYNSDKQVTDSYELYSRDLRSGSPAAEVPLTSTAVKGGGVTSYSVHPTDGRILFTTYQTSLTVEDLYVIDTNAVATPNKVNATMPDGASIGTFRWSPDGATLLYVADQETLGRREGWFATISGTTAATAQRFNQALTTFDAVGSAEFTPDSANILYRADHDTDGRNGIWRVSLAGGVGAAERLTVLDETASDVDVSANSAWIGFRSSGGLYVNSIATPATPAQVTVAGEFAQTGLRFSADGEVMTHRVNFASGAPFQLHATATTMPAASTRISVDPHNGLGIIYTEWAPTGARLAYDFETADGSRELLLIEFTGTTAGAPTRISDAAAGGAKASDPRWADNGESLSYQWRPAGSDQLELYWVDLSAASPATAIRVNDDLLTDETIQTYAWVP